LICIPSKTIINKLFNFSANTEYTVHTLHANLNYFVTNNNPDNFSVNLAQFGAILLVMQHINSLFLQRCRPRTTGRSGNPTWRIGPLPEPRELKQPYLLVNLKKLAYLQTLYIHPDKKPLIQNLCTLSALSIESGLFLLQNLSPARPHHP
jgi:hypothetical protein